MDGYGRAFSHFITKKSVLFTFFSLKILRQFSVYFKKKITLGVSNDFDIPDKRIFDSEENMRMYKHM